MITGMLEMEGVHSFVPPTDAERSTVCWWARCWKSVLYPGEQSVVGAGSRGSESVITMEWMCALGGSGAGCYGSEYKRPTSRSEKAVITVWLKSREGGLGGEGGPRLAIGDAADPDHQGHALPGEEVKILSPKLLAGRWRALTGSDLHLRNLSLRVTVWCWGWEQGEADRREGGEEIAVGQARNYLISSELYLHLIFLHLLVLFSPLGVFFSPLG